MDTKLIATIIVNHISDNPHGHQIDFVRGYFEIVMSYTLDTIADGQGWEESRDHYAEQLGLKTIYK
jgi:hypothetical protein